MVSSPISGLTKTSHKCKPLPTHLFYPTAPLDVQPDNIELDFSDVFGPLPSAIASTEEEVNEFVYDDPVVVYNRSHSLVGPSTCISQSLKLKKLTLHETDDERIIEEAQDSVMDKHAVIEKPSKKVHTESNEPQCVGLDDFEVMKVVGQGAFGKVYQVRKKGSSEIYAMKVMRKDKIMEKNHAEYMKAERDILTKIDHPFIVRLRYSFQVISDLLLNNNFEVP